MVLTPQGLYIHLPSVQSRKTNFVTDDFAAGPKIVSMKKEVACVVGQKLDYRVEVEGEPTPEIRW